VIVAPLVLVWRFLPLLVLLLAWLLARSDWQHLFDSRLVIVLPYILACVAAGLAATFNRSRLLAPVLIAVLTYHCIRERLQLPLLEESAMALFTGLNLLFCGQLIMAALLPDKGLFNRNGLLWFTLLLAGYPVWWLHGQSAVWTDLLAGLPLSQGDWFEQRHWITQGLVACHLATITVLALTTLLRRSLADAALLLTWLAGVLVFADFAVVEVSSLCYAALLIGLGILYQQSNYRVTFRDALTGIPGRRALDDYLTTLGRRYAIAMLDVDHFKKFNDTHGHEVGDQVLKMVAAKIARVEGGGKGFRYGGEEFTIVFPRRNAEEAFAFLEAVRLSIESYQMTLRGADRVRDRKAGKRQRGKSGKTSSADSVSVTISIGVADSQSGLSAGEVIKRADSLLYRAKEAGRNCTVSATEPVSTPSACAARRTGRP